MELLILAVVIFGVAAGTLLDTALAADGDLGVGLLLHALLGVAARSDDQPDEIVARIVLLGDEHLRTRIEAAERIRQGCKTERVLAALSQRALCETTEVGVFLQLNITCSLF